MGVVDGRVVYEQRMLALAYGQVSGLVGAARQSLQRVPGYPDEHVAPIVLVGQPPERGTTCRIKPA